MAKKFLTALDLNLNELQNFIVQQLATDPQNPVEGQIWYNTASDTFKFKDGTTVRTFANIDDLTTALEDYQAKITANGILKGNGSGTVSAAEAGVDYGYIELTGTTDPTTSTEGAVGQHYLNTASGVEFICKAVTTGDTPTYTWVPVTVDISDKQDTITATGILKGEGSGTVTAATAGTDYGYALLTGSGAPTTSTEGAVGQKYYDTASNVEYICTAVSGSTYTWTPTVTATASKALVTNASGAVEASSVTATELSYLSGATGNIQTQIDNIPKYNYKNGVSCSVSDGATQEQINTAATTAITTAYPTATKWDAVVVAVTFTPSDIVKDAMYYYNGSAWTFLYYVTTGVQLANGTTAGLIQEAESDSDLTLAAGVATVNVATALRTARTIGLIGSYNDGSAQTDGITNTAASFDGSGNVSITVTAIKTVMLDGQVAVANGGTGKSSITEGALLIGNASGEFDEIGVDNAVTTDSDNLITSGAVAAAIGGGNVAHKYSENNAALTPSSGVATWTVSHGLNTRDVTVLVYDLSDYSQVIPDVELTSTSAVTIKINASSTIAADSYRVVVIG